MEIKGFGDIIQYLWYGIEDIGKILNIVWKWLTEAHLLGFKIPLIGEVGMRIVPLEVIGVGFITIMALWIIKALVPLL